jgi:flagellar export protein FliJ
VKRRLERVVRIRRLLEELAHADLGRQIAEARALEQSAAAHREGSGAARADAWKLLETAATPSWLLGMSDADLLAWKGGQLEALAVGRQPGIEAARQELLSRRIERRQLEILDEAAARLETREGIRREQKAADDWFQSRAAHGKRR